MDNAYVGMGGWDLFPFNKTFYPTAPGKNFRKLEYYSCFFDLVEINATFYNTAFTSRQIKQWIADVEGNPGFIFTVKLFRGFTHTLLADRKDLKSVHALLGLLAAEGKLGGVVMQFPYSFTNVPERREYVGYLADLLKPHTVFAEVRHNSWNTSAVTGFFREHGIITVNVDLPRISKHMPLTDHSLNGYSYFRMMGRNASSWRSPWRVEEDGRHAVSDRYHYLYSESEIGDLFGRIIQASLSGSKSYVIFHNDPNGNSLVNGFQLNHLLRKKKIPVPKSFVTAHPLLMPISAAANVVNPLFAMG